MYNKKLLLNAILREDLSCFISKCFNTINPGQEYVANWHIDLISEYLIAVEKNQINRLIINIPPRSLKSICINVAWTAWLLGHNPSKRIISASYSSVLSIKHSLDCQIIINSDWFKNLFPECEINKKVNNRTKFLTTKNGFRFATSIGGSLTGEGGDILIIDDPHNPTHINSLKQRKKVIEWFENSFITRLNNKKKGAIILVMQRLHPEDLTAHLLNSKHWQLLKIPSVSPENITYKINGKKYNFNSGNLLNLKLDELQFLQNIEQEIGSKNYAAQYLQDPIANNYNFLNIEDLIYYEQLPESFEMVIHSWDTAIKISDNADYSVGTFWGVSDKKYYLLKMVRKKMDYPELKNSIIRNIKKYRPQKILIEDKASGGSLIQDLKFENYTNITAIKPKSDKVTRFAATIPLFHSNQVIFPKKSAFNRELVRELTNFPNARNDDIVDSVSQFLNYMRSYKRNGLNIRNVEY